MKNIGILTTLDHPLLSFFLDSFNKNGLRNYYVICDSKLKSTKSTNIWNERTGGKFKELFENKLTKLEEHASSEFYFVDNHNSEMAHKLYDDLNIQCLFNAGTPRKIHKETIDMMKYGVVNIHPGLLPKYRGSCAVEWAIFNSEKVFLTAHQMNEDYDAGPIIDIHEIRICHEDSYEVIRNKVFYDTTILAGKILSEIQNNFEDINLISQKEENSIYWEPIDDESFEEVKLKVNSGNYFKEINR